MTYDPQVPWFVTTRVPDPADWTMLTLCEDLSAAAQAAREALEKVRDYVRGEVHLAWRPLWLDME